MPLGALTPLTYCLWVATLLLSLWSGAWAEEKDAKVEYPYLEHQGQIQFQLNDGALGSDETNNVRTENNGLAPFPAEDHIFIRRFRPVFLLHFSPQWNIDTEFEVDPHLGRVEALDVILNYNIQPNTTLSVGRYKVPFGWEGLRSSRDINTVERSDATVYLYPERDIGVQLEHREEGLGEFTLGTFLGQARSNGDANGSLDLIGRAVFPVGETLRLGASAHLGTFRPTGSGTDLPVRRVGVEAQFEEGPFKVESEAIYSNGYNPVSGIDSKAFGYYVTTVYRVLDPLDLVLNYDRFDPDLRTVDPFAVSNEINARDRKLIGLNYYISREPIHRLMLNYEMRQSLQGPAFDTAGFRFRYQIAW